MYGNRVSSNEGEQKKRLLLVMIMWASCACLVVLLFTTLGAVSTPLTAAINLSTQESAAGGAANSDQYSHPSYHHLGRRLTSSSSSSNAIASACKATLYPDVCESSLASAAASARKSPKDLFHLSVQVAASRVHSARSVAYNLTLAHPKPSNSPPSGMEDCLELLDITLELLDDILSPSKHSSPHDVKTWLSAALTNQVTCTESLQATVSPSAGRDLMNAQAQSLIKFISNSLALGQSLGPRKLPPLVAGGGWRGHRRLLLLQQQQSNNGGAALPAWLSAADRKLIESSPADIRADAVVAKDGSGTHRSISEAIAFVSLASSGGGGRTVIYVKAGTYKENINIPKKQKNVMLMGDGKGKSVVVGNRNAEDGYSTYQTATVAAMGPGFIAKGLSIVNNAGPAKHQAVALRVGADLSVITQCSIEGYQDTLYTHSNRQFYRDNDIYGTVDFIFGNSAVVFQNCYIQPRRPAGGQKNSVTAQGRTDPNQNTGISIQGCKIQGASDLGHTPTYLGRPWHQYSRVVVLQSYLDDSINSAGWEQWSGSFALSTLYYGEYANTGPGASTSGRVRWPGVHPSMSSTEASKFTVAQFIYGNSWLPSTGVTYNAGL